jgi:hypothetical protein
MHKPVFETPIVYLKLVLKHMKGRTTFRTLHERQLSLRLVNHIPQQAQKPDQTTL